MVLELRGGACEYLSLAAHCRHKKTERRAMSGWLREAQAYAYRRVLGHKKAGAHNYAPAFSAEVLQAPLGTYMALGMSCPT